MYACIYVYMHVCVQVCIYVYVCMQHECACVYFFTCMHAYVIYSDPKKSSCGDQVVRRHSDKRKYR